MWGDINTLFEIGLEIYRLMQKSDGVRGSSKNTTTEQIADGVLLISDDKDVLIAVSKETARKALSEAAASHGIEKGDYICYGGAATAIPLFELARSNDAVRGYIVSEESLRATLCGNYPEYVKSWNMAAPPDAHIKDADAPPYLFLQKQLDQAAESTSAEVAEFQQTHAHESAFERGAMDDVLELER